MGTNNLTTRSDGNTIPASDHNELVEALRIDLVPRNNSNAPEDIIGSLGRSDLRWLRAFVQEYRIGNATNNLRIYEGSDGEIWIDKNNGQEGIRIREEDIQFLINGSVVFTLGATSLTTLNNYINHNFIGTRQSKIGFTEGRGAVPSTGLNPMTGSFTLVGCKLGKTFIFDVDIRESLYSGAGSGTPDFAVNVNGSPLVGDNDALSSSTVNPFQKRFQYKLAVPADGDYTFQLVGGEFSQYVASLRVEEV